MKNNIFIYLFACLALFSCQDVIEIDLDEGEEKIHIEAFIENTGNPQVIVSRTTAYDDTTQLNRLANATITISDNAEPPKTARFAQQENTGYYTTTTDYVGEMGRVYTLKVEVDGVVYTATDSMKRIVPIESIEIKKVLPYDEDYSVLLNATEAPGLGDYYRWVVYFNNTPFLHPSGIDIAPDYWVDGNEIRDMVIFDGSWERELLGMGIEDGTLVQVKQMSISKNVYEFYKQLQTLSFGQNMFSPPPANLPTNFDNGAIGLFRASAVEFSKTLEAPYSLE